MLWILGGPALLVLSVFFIEVVLKDTVEKFIRLTIINEGLFSPINSAVK